MKIMAGYDTRNKTNYRAKAAEEVAKVQQKARILEEMLQNYREGDDSINDDTFEVGSASLCSKSETSNGGFRNWPVLWAVLSLRFRKCAKRNQTTQRPSPSYWKSTTAYTGRCRDISL